MRPKFFFTPQVVDFFLFLFWISNGKSVRVLYQKITTFLNILYRLVILPKSSSACDTYGQTDWYTYGRTSWSPYRFFQTPISTMQFEIGFQILWGDHIAVATDMSKSISLSSQPHGDAPRYTISVGGHYAWKNMMIHRCNQVRRRIQLFPSSARTNRIYANKQFSYTI